MSKIFNGKAIFAPRPGWLVAIHTYALYNNLVAATSALLSVKQLCRRLAGYFVLSGTGQLVFGAAFFQNPAPLIRVNVNLVRLEIPPRRKYFLTLVALPLPPCVALVRRHKI